MAAADDDGGAPLHRGRSCFYVPHHPVQKKAHLVSAKLLLLLQPQNRRSF